MKILEFLLLVLTDARILGLYNGSLLVEKSFAEDSVFRRRFYVEFEDDADFNLTIDTVQPFKLIIGYENYLFNSFGDDSSMSVRVGNQVDKGISNITENWIEIQFEDQEKRISAEMNVATSTESLSVPLLSGSLSSSEQERNKLFTGSYGDNLRNILSVSTSVIIPDFPSAVNYAEVRETIVNFFKMDAVNQVQIVDVRNSSHGVVFDVSIGVLVPQAVTFLQGWKVYVTDLFRMLQVEIGVDASFTAPIYKVEAPRAKKAFIAIVTLCSAIIVGFLIAFFVVGLRNEMTKKEILGGWFLINFRPSLLVMAEMLLWWGYSEQLNMIYPSRDSFGIGFVFIAAFGFICSCGRSVAYLLRINRGNKEWNFPWSQGNIANIIGILFHDIPVPFAVYFYFTKYYSVLSSFKLTVMVFQAAHMTLFLKYFKTQRAENIAKRKEGTFSLGHGLTSLLFFFALLSQIMMFARTVALQTGRLAVMSGSKISAVVRKDFTPNYPNFEDVIGRSCMDTLLDENGAFVNTPKPFRSTCLNGIEIGIIVIFGITLFIGLLTLPVYGHAYYKMRRTKTYEDTQPMDQRKDQVEEIPKTTTN